MVKVSESTTYQVVSLFSFSFFLFFDEGGPSIPVRGGKRGVFCNLLHRYNYIDNKCVYLRLLAANGFTRALPDLYKFIVLFILLISCTCCSRSSNA